MTEEEADQIETHLRQRLAVNVRRLRKAKGLTFKQAAERAEMHWRMWQKVEAGETNATVFTVTRLANTLDVDPAELLVETVPAPSKQAELPEQAEPLE